MTRNYGGRMRGQRTGRRTFARRALGVAEPPTLTIFDRWIVMIGADDGAGGSPARIYSEYDNAWTEIPSPPVPFAGGGIDPFSPAPSRFFCGGGYRTDTLALNDRFFEYASPTGFNVLGNEYREFTPACPVEGARCVAYQGQADTSPPFTSWRHFTVVGQAAPEDISYHSWNYTVPTPVYPDPAFWSGSWHDESTVGGAPDSGDDVANIRSTLAFSPFGSSTILGITRTGTVANFSTGVGSFPALTGTNTDSIRLAYNGDPLDNVSMYAIRVQGGVATTAIFNEHGGFTWDTASKAPLPRVRENFGVAQYSSLADYPDDNTRLYVVGGDGTPWLDIYDAATNTWSQGADLDVGVSNVSVSAMGIFRSVPGV